MCLDALECVQTFLDIFLLSSYFQILIVPGSFWMSADEFGCVLEHLDVFKCFLKLLDSYTEIEVSSFNVFSGCM